MNLKNKVKELINISCLNEICNVLPYEDKDIYLIGGATRSILSDKYENKDIDLVIPDLDSLTVDKILDKYDDAKYYPGYKSISLVFNDFEYQINSFRKDIAPSGRHSKVAKATSIKEDSLRRDFTFNTIYLNMKGEVIDPLDNFSDLKNGKVKFVGDAKKRIKEDHLRILRFFRFISKYPSQNSSINLKTLDAIKKSKNLIKKLSSMKIKIYKVLF